MEDSSYHSEDVDESNIRKHPSELLVSHEDEQNQEQASKVEKWQFRKSWEKFFGGIARTVEVEPGNNASINPEQSELSLIHISEPTRPY